MNLEKDYNITTTDSIIAAFAVGNNIEEMVLDNNKVKLLLALDAESDIGLTELIGSVYSKTVTNSLVAWRFVSASNTTDITEMIQYCNDVQDTAARMAQQSATKLAAVKVEAVEVDVNGSPLQQAADAVNYILTTTDQSDEVVQGLNDIADKLQQTSSNVSNICEDLSKIADSYDEGTIAHDSVLYAVEALKANIFFE